MSETHRSEDGGLNAMQIVELDPAEAVRLAWPDLPLPAKSAHVSSSSVHVGTPVAPFGSDAEGETIEIIRNAAEQQAHHIQQLVTPDSARLTLLNVALSEMLLAASSAPMLTSASCAGPGGAPGPRGKGAKFSGNKVATASGLTFDWMHGITKQRVSESCEAVVHLLQGDAKAQLSGSVVTLALSLICDRTQRHHAEVLPCLLAAVKAASAPGAEPAVVRCSLLAAKAFPLRAPDAKKLYDAIRPLIQESASSEVKDIVVDEEIPVTAAGTAAWHQSVDVSFAEEVSIVVDEISGGVQPATHIASDGSVSEVGFSKRHIGHCAGGRLFFSGEAKSSLSCAVRTTSKLTLDVAPTYETNVLISRTLINIAKCVLEARTPTPLGVDAGLISGGLRQTPLADASSLYSADVESVMKRIRCRKSSLPGVRLFARTVVHVCGPSEDVLKAVVSRASIQSEVVGSWTSAQLRNVDWYLQNFSSPVPLMNVSAAMETIQQQLPTFNGGRVKEQIKNRTLCAQRLLFALDVLSTVAVLLPVDLLGLLYEPLSALTHRSDLFDDFSGTGALATSCRERTLQLIAQLFQQVVDLHEQHDEGKRPHHFVTRQQPYLAFALCMLGVAVSPATLKLEGLHSVADAILQLFALPRDMTRSASYRFDSDELTDPRVAEGASRHLERTAEGALFVDTSTNAFSKSGALTFKSEQSHFAQPWTFDAASRAASKTFRIDVHGSWQQSTLVVGLLPFGEHQSATPSSVPSAPGVAVVDVVSGAAEFVDAVDVHTRCSIPVPSTFASLVITVRQTELSTKFGTLAVYADGQVVCRVPVQLTGPVVPTVMAPKGTQWELRTSFGDTSVQALEAQNRVRSPFPTANTLATACFRALFVLSSHRGTGVRTTLTDAMMEECRALLEVAASTFEDDGQGSGAVVDQSKRNFLRWLAATKLLGHMACIQNMIREIDDDLMDSVFSVLTSIIIACRHIPGDIPCLVELRCSALSLARLIVDDRPRTHLPCSKTLLEAVLAHAGHTVASNEGEQKYDPKWAPEHCGHGFVCDESTLSFGNPEAEHLAAFASPSLPQRGQLSAVSMTFHRVSSKPLRFTFSGVGDLSSSSSRLLGDYVSFLKDPKKRLYVIPACPDDARFIASLNNEELKRNRGNWADPQAVFQPGDKITTSVNHSKRTISFARNGRPLGTLFSNIAVDRPLHPFVAVLSSDVSVTVESVATSLIGNPTGVLSLALLQNLFEHDSSKADLSALLRERTGRGDATAMRVLGSDGNPLSVKLLPGGRVGALLSVRMSSTGTAEAVYQTEDGSTRTAPWQSCAPTFADARPNVGELVKVTELLTNALFDMIAVDDSSITVLHPTFVARALRLLLDSDVTAASPLAAGIKERLKAFAGARTSAANERDIIERAWGAMADATDEFITVPAAQSLTNDRAAMAARELLSGDGPTSSSPWFESNNPIPFSLAHSALLSNGSAATVAAGEWVGNQLGMQLTCTEDGAVVTGRGGCVIAPFTVEGVIVAGSRVVLKLNFEFEKPQRVEAEADPDAKWACDVCTFENMPDAARCEMCGSGRSGANWTCAACTYAYNANEAQACGMCGTTRPRTSQESRGVAAAVACICRQCRSEKEVQNVLEFQCDERCSSCGAKSWCLTTPVVAILNGSISVRGDAIDCEIAIRGQSRPMTLRCSERDSRAREAKPTVVKPVGAEAAGSISSAKIPKLSALADGIAFIAKKVLVACCDAGHDTDIIADVLGSLNSVEHQQEILRKTATARVDRLMECAAHKLITAKDAASLRGLLTLVGSVVTLHDESVFTAASVNKTLYAAAHVACVAEDDLHRVAVDTIAKLLEHPKARGDMVARLVNEPRTVSTAPLASVLQSVRGSVLPGDDALRTAAALVLSAVDRMTRCEPIPAVFDRDVAEALSHWILLPQTEIDSDGSLIAGQMQGSIPARRSRKDRMYYEVEVPKNFRMCNVRMGWGTATHGKNAATYHVGSDSHSWAYNLKNVVMCAQGETEYTPPYFVKEGDVIGSAVDLGQGKSWWTINGFEMPSICIDGFIEDDEIFPFISATPNRGSVLKPILTETLFMPEGFKEFSNVLRTVTNGPSAHRPLSITSYKAVNAILDEVATTGASQERLSKFCDGNDDAELAEAIAVLLPSHPMILDELAPSSDPLALRPYIRHLLTLSDVSRVASRIAHMAKDSAKVNELAQHVRYLTVLPARVLMLERVVDRRVNRNMGSAMKVTIDRSKALRSYVAKNVVSASRSDSVIAQLFSQTTNRDIFLHQRMFTVAFAGSIAEDGGGLFRSLLSMIADEIMGNEVDDNIDGGCAATPGRAPKKHSSVKAAASAAADEGDHEAACVNRRTHLFVKNDHSTFFNAVPNPKARDDQDLAMYTWLGRLLGNIVCTGAAVLAVNLPRLFWKTLLGERVTVEHYFHDCCDSVRGALEEEDFLLDDDEFFDAIPGVRKLLPQKEPRDNTERAAKRRQAAEETLVKTYDVQLQAMRDGFVAVVPAEALAEMTWADLQRRVCGASEFSPEDLLSWLDTSLLADGQRDMLREVVKRMSKEQRSKLLLFTSGQTRLPLPERVKVVCGDEPDKFPSAHTCSPISLTIQPYRSVEEALRMFLVSMAHAYEYAFV